MAAVLIVIGAFVLLIAGIVDIALGQAWILQHVWQWYAVTQFGMPQLRMSHCFLLMYVVGLLTHQQKEDKKNPWAPIAGLVLGWVLFLAFAWWLR